MSVPSFDPSRVSGYGTSGQETARKMASTLKAHSLSVTYNADNKKFTIHNSSEIDKETIAKIFSEAVYEGWQPQVLDETDDLGNRLVQLRAIVELSGAGKTVTATSASLGRSWTRDDYAAQLVSNIQDHLGVSLSGKTCIDVGCRSGENAIAMERAGAKVIGIDPDDTEFATAKAKGMTGDQLVKATLQEYQSALPDQKFDIATVFLWNIPHKERESFVAALATIIQPDGYVIIGYADEPYDKDPYINVPKLMREAFGKVERFEFAGSMNRYMLKCSAPRTL